MKVEYDNKSRNHQKKKKKKKKKKNMSVQCIPHGTQLLYSKTGVCSGIPIFLCLLQNIDCGYSLEQPRRGGSNVYPQYMF